jgi:hypothetical protein
VPEDNIKEHVKRLNGGGWLHLAMDIIQTQVLEALY